MQIQVRFDRNAPRDEISELREEYLSSLNEPQQLMLELLATSGEVVLIRAKDVCIGYAILHEGDTWVEYYLKRDYWCYGEHVAVECIRELKLKCAMVKSFDGLFLSSVIAHQREVQSLGLLVRDYIRRELPKLPSVQMSHRKADMADFARLQEIEQDVFSDLQRLAYVIERGFVQLYESGEELVGFGILRPIREGSSVVDLGIAVATRFRRRGHAAFILQHLADLAIERGLRPVAGCAQENVASRNLGDRVGLVARYRLLRIIF